MSYTFDLSKVLNIYLRLLKLNGSVLMQMSFVKNPEKPLEQDLFFDKRGHQETDFQTALQMLFSKVEGIQTDVEALAKSDFNGVARETFRIEIKKVSSDFKVPPIQTLHFFSYRPVRRHLQIQD
jgi:hypothetical protein